MIEAAITVMVVITLVYGILEFSRFLSARSAMQQIAQAAAAEAAVVPSLEEETTTNQYGQTLSEEAQERVENNAIVAMDSSPHRAAIRIPTGGNPQVVFPERAVGESLTQALQRAPMTVTLTYEYQPMIRQLSFLRKTVSVTSAVQREIAPMSSYPKALNNCNSEWDPTAFYESGGLWNCPCAPSSTNLGPCGPGQRPYRRPGTDPRYPGQVDCYCTCADSPGPVVTSSLQCACSGGVTPNPDGTCNCPGETPCPAGQYYNTRHCACEDCGQFQRQKAGNSRACECVHTQNCPPGQIRSLVYSGPFGPCPSATCTCQPGLHPRANPADIAPDCSCRPRDCSGIPGAALSQSSCRCECTDPQYRIESGRCVRRTVG